MALSHSFIEGTEKRCILEGDDVEIAAGLIPYRHIDNLGVGAHGIVEKVEDVITGRCYARKTFLLHKSPFNKVRDMFQKEVEIMRQLSAHPHIIRVHATYTVQSQQTSGRKLAVLLQPVASHGNLKDYLGDFQEYEKGSKDGQEGQKALSRAFGCLASCLEYIHSDRFSDKPIIRHKDIKPSNILIHEGFVMFTDFGISRCCPDDRTTTGGKPDWITEKYCAPEVADYDQRNRKADIFSLGCVFLEIACALWPDTAQAGFLKQFTGPYHREIEEIQSRLSTFGPGTVEILIRRMLNRNPTQRPSAEDVLGFLQYRNNKQELECSKCKAFNPTWATAQPRLRLQHIDSGFSPNDEDMEPGSLSDTSSESSMSATDYDVPGLDFVVIEKGHKETHTNASSFNCPHEGCSATFRGRYGKRNLARHANGRHRANPQTTDNNLTERETRTSHTQENENSTSKLLTRTEKRPKDGTQVTLTVSDLKLLDEALGDINLFDNSLKCRYCPGKYFGRRRHLERHTRDHHKCAQSSCTNLRFENRLKVEEHERLAHQELWKFQCGYCDTENDEFIFKNLDKLRLHWAEVHQRWMLRNIICPERNCNCYFEIQGDMMEHRTRKHLKRKA